MNEHETDRIAAAIHAARPDWPVSSIRTLIRKHLADYPRRDVFVALAWVASEPNTATPARVLESGPWWRAVGVDGATTGKRETFDRGATCGICGKSASTCAANPWSGHEFESVHDRDKRVAAEQAARRGA